MKRNPLIRRKNEGKSEIGGNMETTRTSIRFPKSLIRVEVSQTSLISDNDSDLGKCRGQFSTIMHDD